MEMLCFGEYNRIRRAFAVRTPQVKNLVSHPLKERDCALGEILVEEEPHATASYAEA